MQAADQRTLYTPAGADDLRTLLRVCYAWKMRSAMPAMDSRNLVGAMQAWHGVTTGDEWITTGASHAEEAALLTAAGGSSQPNYAMFATRLCEFLS